MFGKRLLRAFFMVVIALAVMNLAVPCSARISDPAYHHVDEIYTRIFALQDSLPGWVRVDSIGYSQEGKLPIYAVKISRNVDDTTTIRPAVVIVGQVHAEEVLGVEFCMWLLEKAVSRESDARNWLRSIDLWIVPTANPDGLNAVYTEDHTFRKNTRDMIGDGRFRFITGWGGDTSGVDLNRNFPLFWIKGDPFLMTGRTEPYDYFRGPAPFSEAETRALDRLMERVRPMHSVVLHSSRTGNFAEKVIYPWAFGVGENLKYSPDVNIIHQVAIHVASRCQKLGESGHYEPAAMTTPNGNSDAYFYWRYNSLSYRIEIGGADEGMQPDSAGIMQVIDGCRPGIEYYLNSAAGVRSDDFGDIEVNRLVLKVTDQGGNPLEARLVFSSLSTPLIPYRTTNPRNGAFQRILFSSFFDTLTVSKFGYRTRQGLVMAQLDQTPLQVELEVLPRHQIIVQTFDQDSLPIEGQLELEIEHLWSPSLFGWRGIVDTVPPVQFPPWHPGESWTHTVQGGRIQLELPDGGYRFTLLKGNEFVPRRIEKSISSDTTLNVTLSRAHLLLDQNFDGGDVIYTSDNVMNLNGMDSLARWDLTNDICHTPPRCLTDSRWGNTIRGEDGWCAPYNLLDDHFDLSSARTATLVYWLNQALEPGYDSLWVEVSTGWEPGSSPSEWDWTQVAPAHQELSFLEDVPIRPWNAYAINLQQFAPWRRFVVSLDDFCGEPVVHFRFHLRSDEHIEMDGVYIDDVQLLASNQAPPEVTSNAPLPRRFTMWEPYPNPFNSLVQVRVSMPEAGRLKMTLFDILGRPALQVPDEDLPAGTHRITVDAAALPTGLYLLRAGANGSQRIKKVMLIK